MREDVFSVVCRSAPREGRPVREDLATKLLAHLVERIPSFGKRFVKGILTAAGRKASRALAIDALLGHRQLPGAGARAIPDLQLVLRTGFRLVVEVKLDAGLGWREAADGGWHPQTKVYKAAIEGAHEGRGAVVLLAKYATAPPEGCDGVVRWIDVDRWAGEACAGEKGLQRWLLAEYRHFLEAQQMTARALCKADLNGLDSYWRLVDRASAWIDAIENRLEPHDREATGRRARKPGREDDKTEGTRYFVLKSHWLKLGADRIQAALYLGSDGVWPYVVVDKNAKRVLRTLRSGRRVEEEPGRWKHAWFGLEPPADLLAGNDALEQEKRVVGVYVNALNDLLGARKKGR